MSSQVINYICCPNGFGHFKRFGLLNSLFEKKKINVNLYTNKNAWINFINFNKISFSNIKVINYNLPTYNKDKNETLDFFKNMSKNIDKNIIISDNYEEICFFKKNVILISNFFWNISAKDKKYLNKLNINIIKNKCLLFGNMYFSANYIKIIPNFTGVGFFGNKIKIKNNSYKKNKILFVKGFGSYKKNFENDFKELYHSMKTKYEIIFDSNIFFAKNLNLNTAKIFDDNLFSKLKLIIGRPSFGILTDAISRDIPFLPLSDKNDLESIETKLQINKIFGKNNSIDDYVVDSANIYNNHLFSFKAESKLFKIIIEQLNET